MGTPPLGSPSSGVKAKLTIPALQQQEQPGQRPTATDTPEGVCPAVTSVPMARLRCHNCTRLLEYDAGAQYVQCFSCSVMNAVTGEEQVGGRVLSMLCAICNTTNLAPYGINFVRCGKCSTISQVSHAYSNDPGAAQAAAAVAAAVQANHAAAAAAQQPGGMSAV